MANLATINENILADSGIDPIDLIVGTGTVNYIPKFTAEGTIGNSIMTESGANILISSNIVLHAGNYNSYAPTLTGGGASGTWSINITGNANYATSAGNADTVDGFHASAFALVGGSNAVGTWPISVTGTSGYANSAGVAGLVNGTSGGAIQSWDIRTIAPSSMTSGRLGFGFTSWNNDNNPPWADYLHLRSYTDNSGGNDNLIMFLKNGIGMRIYQQAWGSSAPYVTYVDMLDSGNFNTWAPTLTGGGASGTWAISITGNADTVDGLHASAFALTNGSNATGTWGINISGNAASATTFNGLNFNGLYARFTGDINSLGLTSTSGIYNIGTGYTNGPAGDLYGTLFGIWNYDISVQFWASYNGDFYWRKSIGNSYVGAAWRTLLDSSNYTTYAVQNTVQSNWNSFNVIANVVGLLAWKNYGNNHVIFDASKSTSPSGTGIDSSNSQVAWAPTYPTLMGWNGSNTYGVRVDSARVADSSGSASTVPWSGVTGTPTTLAGYGITDAVPSSRTLTINGVTYDLSANRSWTIAAGVTSILAGAGISVDQNQGDVTVSNTGVLSVNGNTGDITGIATTAQLANYLPLAGGTMSGTIYFVNNIGTALQGTMGDNDFWRIYGAGSSNAGYLEIATSDDATEPIYISQYTGVFNTLVRRLILLDGSGNTSFPGFAESSNSFRAPIFYDSADTSYYLDPNSTSRLYRINSYYLSSATAVSDNHEFGLYFDSGLSTAYAIYRTAGAWTHPYPDLRIAFHTGIQIGANASYQGVRFYTDYDMTSQVMSVNNGSDPLGGGNVYVDRSLQAGNSLRAPIFYDSDNTAYYVDPNNTSNLLTALILNTYVGNAIYFGGGNNYLNWDGARINSNVGIQSTSDMRAPIFYDSNDTGYYLDPNGQSNLYRAQFNQIGIGDYSQYAFSLPYPGANFGNGRIYIRLHPVQARIVSFKIKISSTWNWAAAFGYISADVSYYCNGTDLYYPQVNITSATGQALYTLAFGDLVIENGYVSLPVYSSNSNGISVKIEGSPSFDFSLISYSSYASVSFPGANTVNIPGNFNISGTGTMGGNTLATQTWVQGYAVPQTRTLTINGVTYDLSANRSWTISSGVNSIIAGQGISVDQAQGDVTISNTGVLSVNGDTGAVTGVLTTSNYTSYTVQAIYGDSGAYNLNISGQQSFFRYSTGQWVNGPIVGNYSHVLSVNLAADNRTFQVYYGDIPGALYWRMSQGPSVGFHPWERILTSANYTSYSPTLTGGGASGTWGINITGNAATATTATNANTVGGISADRIVYGSNSTKSTGNDGGDINVALSSGFYDGYAMVGAPTASTYYHLIVNRHSNAGNNYQMQFAGNFFNSGLLYYRIIDNNTPSGWAKIWTSANDGAGSGLDADLLDGINSDGFYRQYGTIAPAGGLDGTSIGWTALDGYGAPVPNYPSVYNQWWVGVWQGGDSVRGIQIAGGYADKNLFFRKGQDTWQPWIRVITDDNYNSYSPTLTGGGASGTWAISVSGNSATTSQTNFTTLTLGGNGVATQAWVNAQGFATGGPFLPTAGGTMTGQIYGPSVDDTTYGGLIQVRERGYVLGTQSDWSYSPAITFHWGNRAAVRVGLRYDGIMAVNNVPFVIENGAIWGISINGSAGSAAYATYLNSSNYIVQRGNQGGWNADFQATPAASMSYGGDVNASTSNNPGGTWWMQQNFRHTNGSSYWGVQVAWGWEDNANRLATRNITGGNYGAWVYYLNSVNYTDYTVSKTGGGASGTWSINITGLAGSETLATVTGRGQTTSNSMYILAAGEGFTYRTSNGWGGWARNAFTIADGSNNVLAAFGGYGGSGTSISYAYIGTSYLSTWARFTASNAEFAGGIQSNAGGDAIAIEGAQGRIRFRDQDLTWYGYVGFRGNTGVLEFPGRNVQIVSGYNGIIELSTGVSGYNSGTVRIPYGNLEVQNGAVYAPIYYDYNDSTFYLNPNSLSNLYTLRVGNGAEVPGLIGMGAGFLYGMGVTNAYTAVHAHPSANGVALGSYNGSTFTSKFYVNNDGNAYAVTAMHAPIFYDSNNTAFYLDPNSYSNLYNVGINQLTFGSSFNGRYTEWYCGIGYGPASGGNRYEVARIGIDFNDWNAVGTFEVELQEIYFYAGGRKRYVISYGYGGPVIQCSLVELNGVGSFSNYQVTVGSEVVVSGDWRYLPVYVDMQYYSQVAIKVRTSRSITNSTVPEVGTAKIFTSPSATGIGGFSVDNTVYPTSGAAPISNPDIYTTNYFNLNTGRYAGEHGYAARFISSQSALSNHVPYSFESTYGNHSWGVVARFHIGQAGADRPSIQFSNASNNTRWGIGYCYADDNFRIVKDLGMAPDGSTGGWGTEYFKINTDGTTYLGIQGNIVYFGGAESANLYGVRGRFTNEYIHLYNKVGIGDPRGWGVGQTDTPTYGLSTYGGINIAYGNSALSTFNGPITSPAGTFTNDGASRVLYLKGSGNIIQFTDAASVFKWEVVGRDGQFYVYKNDGAGSGYIWQINSNGTQTFYTASTFNSTVTATGFFESSDARLKTIVDENYRVDSIVSIKPKFYEKNGKFEAGYIAQEVDKIYSHAVIIGDDGYLSLSYGQIHTLKIAALEDSVDEIKKKIEELEQKLNTLY